MIRTCTAVGCNYYEFELLAARSYGMQSDRQELASGARWSVRVLRSSFVVPMSSRRLRRLVGHFTPAQAVGCIAPAPASLGEQGEDARLKQLFGSHCYSEGPLFPVGGGGRKYQPRPINLFCFSGIHNHVQEKTDSFRVSRHWVGTMAWIWCRSSHRGRSSFCWMHWRRTASCASRDRISSASA